MSGTYSYMGKDTSLPKMAPPADIEGDFKLVNFMDHYYKVFVTRRVQSTVGRRFCNRK